MKTPNRFIFPILMLTLVVVVVLDIAIGSVMIPWDQIYAVLTGGDVLNPGWETIVLQFRVPKAITAVLAGSGLAISGLLMQTLFRNPLAGPFVLGISSGASLGVALMILAGSALGMVFTEISVTGSWVIITAAITGASLVLLLVLVISLYVRDSMSLLIIGLMMGSLSGALVSVLQYFSDAQEIQSFLIWTFGNLGGVHQHELVAMTVVVVLGLMASWYFAKPLNALLLGEAYAKSLGVDVKSIRIGIIVITSVLAGGITAFCGPLAFIGIAIPHLARIFLKTANHRYLIPGCILLGAIVMTLCDLVSQMPGSSRTLPINAITSLVGAPVVIAILMKSRSLSKSFS